MIMVADGVAFGMFMGMAVIVTVVIMVLGIGDMVPGVVGMIMHGEFRIARLLGLRRIDRSGFDHIALDPFAAAAAARIAVARALAAAAGSVVGLFFGLAMGALVGFDQRLTVGDWDLVIIRVDFAESEETVAIAAIFDESGLQRRLNARYLGEVNVTAELLALRGLEIKLLDAIAADHDHPGLFRVGRVDQHFVWHLGAHDGGRRAWRQAQKARPGDATVHLIRG
ncbi:hypothetical protein [Tardiphaga sp.]|uniref:hypothetical protein n=1 Tax=Tardiphaga sp. TaxID=1926292 RepID=UPI0025EBCBD9|nr:hypothetical protein [Tardiphaga sp.]